MSDESAPAEPRTLDPAAKAELDRAFEDLYRAHLRDVYSYAYYRIGNHHDAEDLTEQAFLQAYRHFERARRESNGRPLRPWLIRIAHNLASNYHRDRARRPQTPLENADPIPRPHGTEEVVEGREELRQVIESLGHLPDDRREALIMRFALGMDNREIARALGRTDGATKVLIHRAIKQLQEEMEAVSDGHEPELSPDGRSTSNGCSRRAAADRAAREALRARSRRRFAASPRRPPTSSPTGPTSSPRPSSASLRDPRNWVRPVAAVAAGGVATGALVVLEMRRGGRRHRAALRGLRDLRSRLSSAGSRRPRARRGRPASTAQRRPSAEDRWRTLSSVLTGISCRIVSVVSPLPKSMKPSTATTGRRAEAERVRARRASPASSRPSAPVAMWTMLCQPLTASTRERPRPRPRRRPRSWRCRRSR